jgi:sialic acid synthase SpsE
MDFLERLEEKGVKLVSFEMLDEDLINKFIAKLRKPFGFVN